MEFKSLLYEICKKFGISQDIGNETHFILAINNEHELHLELSEGSDCLYLFAYLFPAIMGHTEALSQKLLEVNAFGKLTKTAQISYSKEKSRYILSEQFAMQGEQTQQIVQASSRY